MSSTLDHFIIAIVVILSAAYAVYALGPKNWRASIRKHVFGRDDTIGKSGCSACTACGSSTPTPRNKTSPTNLASARTKKR